MNVATVPLTQLRFEHVRHKSKGREVREVRTGSCVQSHGFHGYHARCHGYSVCSFRLPGDLNVGILDFGDRKYGMTGMDDFDAEKIKQFIDDYDVGEKPCWRQRIV